MTPDDRANNFQKTFYRTRREVLTQKKRFWGWISTAILIFCLSAVGAMIIYQEVGSRLDKIYGAGRP